jgi:hypothetical protein
MHQPKKKLGFIPPLMITVDWITFGGNWNKAMVLFAEIIFFCIRTKNPMHRLKKIGFLSPLMITAE